MDIDYFKIKNLKKEKQVIILAHNYQLPEIQDIADYVGDSLELSKIASTIDSKIIAFCGVRFMAETAKILSPGKTVLLPSSNAGCLLADMIDEYKLGILKEKHPEAKIVCYINSSVEIKAMSDICCTSANAIKVVESLDCHEVIFIPDKGLGGYVQENSSKKIILIDGYCPTHYLIKKEDLIKAKKLYPDAYVMVHPECSKEVRDLSDLVAGTGKMLNYAKNSNINSFIIGTEKEMIYRLKKVIPEKNFYLMNPKLYCPNMKKTNLSVLYESIAENKEEILISENMMEKAKKPLLEMMKIE